MLGNGSIKPEKEKNNLRNSTVLFPNMSYMEFPLEISLLHSKIHFAKYGRIRWFFPLFFLNCFSIVWLFLQATRNC